MAIKVIPEQRIYSCDRCKQEIKTTWLNEISVHSHVLGADMNYQVCDSCLQKFYDIYMDAKD